jgi:hypothetical protein
LNDAKFLYPSFPFPHLLFSFTSLPLPPPWGSGTEPQWRGSGCHPGKNLENWIWCILAHFCGAFLFQNGKIDLRLYVSLAGLSEGWQQHVQTILTMATASKNLTR